MAVMRWIGYVLVRKVLPAAVMPKSDFSEAGPMNEMVAMGVLAIRLQGLNKTLEWDGANMCFTNIGDNETLRTCI